MNQKNKIVLIIFFPFTAYIFIGTLLFSIITKLDQLTETLANFSEFSGLKDYSSVVWHERNIWLTIFFPITWPLVFIWKLCAFYYSAFAGLLRLVYKLLKKIWEFVVDLVNAIWEWITDAVKTIWRWTVDSVETIWDTITNLFGK